MHVPPPLPQLLTGLLLEEYQNPFALLLPDPVQLEQVVQSAGLVGEHTVKMGFGRATEMISSSKTGATQRFPKIIALIKLCAQFSVLESYVFAQSLAASCIPPRQCCPCAQVAAPHCSTRKHLLCFVVCVVLRVSMVLLRVARMIKAAVVDTRLKVIITPTGHRIPSSV